MDGKAILNLLKTNLAAAMPARVVTRDAIDFARRPKKDIDKGVLTIMAVSVNGLDTAVSFADATGKLRIILSGEFKLPEGSTGSQVEDAEWDLFGQILAFMAAPGVGLCPLNVTDLQLSGQTEAPFGWLLVNLEYSELDQG